MANTIHGVVRTDALIGTSASALLHSVKYMVGEEFAAIDNGSVLQLEALIEGERELFKAVDPTDSAIGKLVLIATPEVMYDERLRNLSDFYNEAGVAARGYVLHSGDIFSVTAPVVEGFDSAAVGSTVGIQGNKWLIGGTGIGSVIAIETVGTLKYVVIRVD